MASTYENELRLEEIGTGEQSGTWGTTTNKNLRLISEAFSYGEEVIPDALTHSILMADATSDAARSMALKCSRVGGTQACLVTLSPNTLSKVWIIENATNSTLTFKQGSGDNGIAIPSGQVKILATDGNGVNGTVKDLLTDVNLAGNTVMSGATIDDVAIDGKVITMTGSDGDTAVFTVAEHGALTVGTTDSASNSALASITMAADGPFTVGGTTTSIIAGSASVDGDIGLFGYDEGQIITAMLIDMSEAGAAAFNSTITSAGSLVKVAGLETIYVPASAMYPNTTNGSSNLRQIELANGPEFQCLDFDASADESAQFTVCFPKSWNEGTVTFQAFWTVTGTDTGTVAWGLSGVSIADSVSVNTAFGTNVVAAAKAFSGDTNDMTVSAVSGAVTIASAAVDTQTYFQIMRDVSADSQTGDARLLGIKLFFTTDAQNDA